MTVLIFTMPVHFGLRTALFPYSWCLKGAARATPRSFLGSAVPWSFVISQPPSWSQEPWFSVLYRCPTPSTACFSRIAFLLRYKEWIWPLGTGPFSGTTLSWCGFGRDMQRAIRSGCGDDLTRCQPRWPVLACDKHLGKLFLVTPGWWLTNSISRQNSRPEPGENVKVSWKKGPQGVLPPRAPGTLLEGECS